MGLEKGYWVGECSATGVHQAQIHYYGQGAQQSFDTKGGALSPKFAQNGGFSLKIT